MAAVEIFLILAGMVAIASSFIFSDKLLINDKKLNEEIEKATEERVRSQVDKAVDHILDDKIENTEAEINKISNERLLEMGDYYKTVSDEISKNHDEVMFLYGMLNDKEKDIKNAVRDIENVKKSISTIQEENTKAVVDERNDNFKKDINKNTNNDTNNDTNNVGKVPETNNTVNLVRSEEEAFDRMLQSTQMKISQGSEENTDEDLNSNSGNNNKEILGLYDQGKSVMEIAKELNLGMGEVRLVIDLYKK